VPSNLLKLRLVVEDFEASLRVLACAIDGACVSGDPERGVAHLWRGDGSGAEIELLSKSAAEEWLPEPARAPTTFVLDTDDVDAAFVRLEAAGAEVVERPRDVAPGATRFARLGDPNGILLESTTPAVASWGAMLKVPDEASAVSRDR
jgi:catechol 2,3-dioxygenase-like lactoylglutathione lyase family enzyme